MPPSLQTYNAWNIAIPLLESHVVIFPNETRCLDALMDLYKGLVRDGGVVKGRGEGGWTVGVRECGEGLGCLYALILTGPLA